MSRFDLRDISERLSRSADAEAVVYEFLGSLQAAHTDWRATLAFYEVSRDSLVKLYERDGDRLRSRDIGVLVDQLPARMIRSFFHPNAFFEPAGRHSVLAPVVQTSPAFHPELSDAVLLRQLLPVANWMSCVCLPIADRDEMLAVLVLVSEKRNAFTGKCLDEVLPLKSMATMALSQRLQRATQGAERPDENGASKASVEIQDQIEQLSLHARELEEDNRVKARRLSELLGQLERVGADDGTEHRTELDRVKQAVNELEQQTSNTSTNLGEASHQLDRARNRIEDQRVTTDLLKDLFELLAEPHDPRQFPKTVLEWVSECFGVGRCSVMLVDRNGHHLRVAVQVGIEQAIADRVRVRIGQGVAGWVALNKKPLFVRMRDERPDLERPNRHDYNTDSFVCVPITYNGRIAGVLSMSNKKNGQPLDETDLERAGLVAGVLAITLGANEVVRRALAWAA